MLLFEFVGGERYSIELDKKYQRIAQVYVLVYDQKENISHKHNGKTETKLNLPFFLLIKIQEINKTPPFNNSKT